MAIIRVIYWLSYKEYVAMIRGIHVVIMYEYSGYHARNMVVVIQEYMMIIIRGIWGYHTRNICWPSYEAYVVIIQEYCDYPTRNWCYVLIIRGVCSGYHTVILMLYISYDLVECGSMSTAQGTLLKANYSQYHFNNLFRV